MTTQTSANAAQKLTNGRAAAALLAAGIGCGFLGVIVFLSEVIGPVGTALNWMNPVGPLSGKVISTIVVFLVELGWAALRVEKQRRQLQPHHADRVRAVGRGHHRNLPAVLAPLRLVVPLPLN